MKKNSKARKPRLTIAAPAAANIYIVDGHPIVVCGLSTLIHSIPGYRVLGANSDWNLALSEIEKSRPDLLLLELSLKRRNGLGILKDLQVRIPKLKVLVVSMDEEVTYALRALKAGAMGYVMKQAPTETLLEAIRTVLAGQLYLSGDLSRNTMRQLVGSRPPDVKSPFGDLSDRELEVYSLIGDGVTTMLIAKRLFLSVKTIETHRSNIKQKLKFPTTSELTRQAIHSRR